MDKKFGSAEPENRRVADQQFLHTEQAGAIVPLLQAVITGFMLGLAVFAILTAFRLRDAWLYGLVTWLVVQAVTWLALATHWFSLTNLERITGRDINGDGIIGAPTRQRAKAESPRWGVRVTLRDVRQSGHLNVRYMDLPGDPAAIVMLATALLGGASIAERLWSGDGKPFSQDDFRTIKKIFKDENLIQPKSEKDKRQGYELTADGKTVMADIREQYASMATPAPLGEDD